MITAQEFDHIKNIIFPLLKFDFDGEITTEYFDGVKVDFDGKTARIGCKDKTDLSRGLFLLALNSKDGAFSVEEKRNIDQLGIHLDMCRNRVLKVETVKKFIEYMAALGFNSLRLYIEDIYHMEKYPYLGYMRGRYEVEELKEIDDYAYSLGIEVVPGVQALGHMEQYLRWNESNPIKDTDSCLLVGVPETYEFIEEMLKTMRKALRTNKIALGIDETHDLGSGAYLDKFGYKPRLEILYEHLEKVQELCRKYNYESSLSVDMFFRLKSKNGGYYDEDVNLDEEDGKRIPEGMIIDYWDYYFDSKEHYVHFINESKKLGHPVRFQGAMWSWEGFLEDVVFTYRNSVPAMLACLETGIDDVCIAQFGDDGTETNPMDLVSTMPLFSEMCYKGRECSLEELDKVSEFISGVKFSDKLEISKIHQEYHSDRYFVKRIFYTDLLYDLVQIDYDFEKTMNIFSDALELVKAREGDYFRYCEKFLDCAMKKCDILNRIRPAYKNNDREYLKKVCEELIPELICKYNDFHELFADIWLETAKPFGLETTDIRIAGAIKRMERTAKRIEAYLDGKVQKLDELEEEHLVCNEWTFPMANRFMSASVII